MATAIDITRGTAPSLEPPDLPVETFCDCGGLLQTATEQHWGMCETCLDRPIPLEVVNPDAPIPYEVAGAGDVVLLSPVEACHRLKLPPEFITLRREEGLTYEVVMVTIGGSASESDANLWRAAEQILQVWARTAPLAGFHRCTYTVTYEDGERLMLRYDLQRDSDGRIDAHLDAYTRLRVEQGDGESARWTAFRETYQIGSPA